MSKNEAMKYGYARVSTDDQKADLQTAALKKAGCEYVFTETASGSSAKRPELKRCLPAGGGCVGGVEARPAGAVGGAPVLDIAWLFPGSHNMPI